MDNTPQRNAKYKHWTVDVNPKFTRKRLKIITGATACKKLDDTVRVGDSDK